MFHKVPLVHEVLDELLNPLSIILCSRLSMRRNEICKFDQAL